MSKTHLLSLYHYAKNKPMLAMDESFKAFETVMDAYIRGDYDDDDFSLTADSDGMSTTYDKVGDIAIINFVGFTVNSASPLEEMVFGVVSLQRVYSAIQQAINDESINKVVLNFDSGGGFIMGLPELTQLIQESVLVKPIYAYTSGLMCSAAYFAACNCTNIIASPSSLVGNVGVLRQYATVNGESISKDGMTKNNVGDVTVTTFQSGTEKTIGNPYVPLTPDQEQSILAEINDMGTEFRELVNEQRGGVDNQFLQGKAYTGQQAMDLDTNLIDGTMNSLGSFVQFIYAIEN